MGGPQKTVRISSDCITPSVVSLLSKFTHEGAQMKQQRPAEGHPVDGRASNRDVVTAISAGQNLGALLMQVTNIPLELECVS